MRKLLLLRPEPGLSASVTRARALGLDVIACPLFRVGPVEWALPDSARFDGLLLTSANALRNGGPGLRQLAVGVERPEEMQGVGDDPPAALRQSQGLQHQVLAHGGGLDEAEFVRVGADQGAEGLDDRLLLGPHVVSAPEAVAGLVTEVFLQRGPRATALVLGCPGSLLARWVIPRLERLAHDLPDLTLHLSAQEGRIDLAAAGLDAALLLGEAPWPPGWVAACRHTSGT